MSALLRLLTPLMYVVALVLATKRRKLTRALMKAGATAPNRSIPLETSGVSGWWVARLIAAGVIRETSPGRYWLDADTYRRYRRVRVVRVAIILALALAAWAVWTLGGVSR